MLGHGSVQQLAWCYLLAGVVGVVLYVLVLYRALKDGGLLAHFRGRRLVPGVRRLMGFSIPLLSTDLFLTLKVNGGGSQQVSAILDALGSLSYQTYSAQQVKGPSAVDFQATLIYHQPD